jgi:hypothetical protein
MSAQPTFGALPRQDGQDLAEIIDMLTMYPEARRQVVRLLGEIEAGDTDPAEL